MKDLKDLLTALMAEIEDVVVEVEDSDLLQDEDARAEIIDSLEDAESSVADAILCL